MPTRVCFTTFNRHEIGPASSALGLPVSSGILTEDQRELYYGAARMNQGT